MAKSSPPDPGDDGEKYAEVEWLFRDEPRRPASPAPSIPTPGAGDEGYNVEGGDFVIDEEVAPTRVVPQAQAPAPAPAPPKRKRTPSTESADSVERPAPVDETWSRWAEWGPTLTWLSAIALATLVSAYVTLSNEAYGLAGTTLLLGIAALGVCSYPIMITLERPVRITPEQAVKDFYGALSHLRPHYRRMWLLLSSAGRVSVSFTSFGEFRDYWNEQLASLGGAGAGFFNPLRFTIEDFRSEKSAGQSVLPATFVLKVASQGRPDSEPIARLPAEVVLVRGPDRMWYLNHGTLPSEPRDRPSRTSPQGD